MKEFTEDYDFEDFKKFVENYANPYTKNWGNEKRNMLRGMIRRQKNEEELKNVINQWSVNSNFPFWDEFKKGFKKKRNREKEKKERPGKIFSKIKQAETFLEKQPMFYDKNKLWWIWNFEKHCYEKVDETDVLNSILEELNVNIIKTQERNEILNSLKQVGRMNIPKEPKPCWVQFGENIIDVETDERIKANPKYFITNPIPWDVGESEETPEIDKLFVSWIGEEKKEELYEVLSFCLIPKYFIHRIICLIGSGANGKGTFLKILKKFLGEENITSSSLELLMSSRFEGAKLYKKLVCLMGETNFTTIKRTEYIKSATGQDTIRGEYKRINPFDFENYAKFIISTNALPMTQDKTIGFYRRWKIIDFNNQFEKEKDVIKNIPKQEFENLALKCLKIVKRLWKERNFMNDENFKERKRRYEERSNPIMLFIKENFEKDINENVIFRDFYNELRGFFNERGFREITAKGTSKILKEEGYDVKKTTKKGITTTRIFGIKPKKSEKNEKNKENQSSLNRITYETEKIKD